MYICMYVCMYVLYVCMYGIKCNNASGLHNTLKLPVWRFMHTTPRLCIFTLRLPHLESISLCGACYGAVSPHLVKYNYTIRSYVRIYART